MIGFAALLLFWTISQHQTTVDAGTPITRGEHCCTSYGCKSGNSFTENDVQCDWGTVGAYFCEKIDGGGSPSPANCGLAAGSPVCLYGSENQCSSAVGGGGWTYQFRCWEGFENTHQVDLCEKCKTGQYRGRSVGGLSRVDVQGESCSLCVPGTYANQEALMACDECQKGQYQPGSCTKDDADGGPDGGCTACKYCPPGQYTDENKQSSCKTCDAGKFYSSSGGQTATVCVVCSGGTFSKSAASTTCDSCPAGYVTPTGGTAADHVTCGACSIGQYSAGDGGTTCMDCEVGKYIDLQHQSACLFCSAGQETNRGENAKGTACVDCKTNSPVAKNAPLVVWHRQRNDPPAVSFATVGCMWIWQSLLLAKRAFGENLPNGTMNHIPLAKSARPGMPPILPARICVLHAPAVRTKIQEAKRFAKTVRSDNIPNRRHKLPVDAAVKEHPRRTTMPNCRIRTKKVKCFARCVQTLKSRRPRRPGATRVNQRKA
jgi:hypothetical protein